MKITKRPVSPLLVAIAALVAAGSYVHLREWLGGYRTIPSAVPGAAVVKVGFPITAAISAVLVVVLIAMACGGRTGTGPPLSFSAPSRSSRPFLLPS